MSITIFLLPPGATGKLTSDGWIFSSSSSMPCSIVDTVVQYFQTPFDEEFLGIKKFKNDLTQINVIFNGNSVGEIAIRTNTPLASIDNLRARIKDIASICMPQGDSLIQY
jgi:hypothetical protein